MSEILDIHIPDMPRAEINMLLIQGLGLLEEKMRVNKSMVELSIDSQDNRMIAEYYAVQMIKIKCLIKDLTQEVING